MSNDTQNNATQASADKKRLLGEEVGVFEWDWRPFVAILLIALLIAFGWWLSWATKKPMVGWPLATALFIVLAVAGWDQLSFGPDPEHPNPEVGLLTFLKRPTRVVLRAGYIWLCLRGVFGVMKTKVYPENLDLPVRKYLLPGDSMTVDVQIVLTGWPNLDPNPEDKKAPAKQLLEYLLRHGEEGVKDSISEAADPILNGWFASSTEGPQVLFHALGAADEAVMIIAKAWDPEYSTRITPMNEPEFPTPVLMHWASNPDLPWSEAEKPYFAKLAALSVERKTAIRAKVENRKKQIKGYRNEEGSWTVYIPWLGFKATRLDISIKPTEDTLKKVAKAAEEAVEASRGSSELEQGNKAIKFLMKPVKDGGWGMNEEQARAYLVRFGRLGNVATTQAVHRLEVDDGLGTLIAAILKKFVP